MAKAYFVKFCKMINVFMCFSGFLYQIFLLTIEYQQGKTVVSLQLGRIQSGQLPAITVCLPDMLFSTKKTANYFSIHNELYSEYSRIGGADPNYAWFFQQIVSTPDKHSISAYEMLTELSIREEEGEE